MINVFIEAQPGNLFIVRAVTPKHLQGALDAAAHSWFYYGDGFFRGVENSNIFEGACTLEGYFASEALYRWVQFMPQYAAQYDAREKDNNDDNAPNPPKAKNGDRYPVTWRLNGQVVADYKELETLLQAPDEEVLLGTFESASTLVLTDPLPVSGEGNFVTETLPGTWAASVVIGPTEFRRKTKQLRIWHEDTGRPTFEDITSFEKLAKPLFSDRGSFGIFAPEILPQSEDERDVNEPGFSRDCYVLTTEDGSVRAGIPEVGRGVVCQSGQTLVTIYVKRNTEGVATALIANFVTDDED